MESRFALQQDNWNDFSFRTLYHLHFRHGDDPGDVTYLGGVKILRMGQKDDGEGLLNEPFKKLSDEWISVGTSLDYYQRMNELPPARRKTIMDALNDAVAHPELVPFFEDEEGWETSLFRGNSDWRSFLKDARTLFEGNFSALADLEEAFSFTPAGADEPINFDFESPEPHFYVGPYRPLGPRKRKTLLPNRIVVLVGRNGSGKSTLLKCLAGIYQADSGTMRLAGRLSPFIELGVGFNPDLPARDNVMINAVMMGLNPAVARERFDEIIAFAEIADFVDTPYKHLSSGMKVRIAFAVISRLDEPVILVDEVLAVGDKKFREKCYRRIDELLAGGRTLFFVSHSDKDLRRFCDRATAHTDQDGRVVRVLTGTTP